MPQVTKRKVGSAFFWNFLGSGGRQFIQFIFGCVLAHILIPKDFGLIAVLSIFSMIANILQDSGFTSALIRKKEVSEKEYSSVFYVNISISIVIYAIFFIFAPIIGHYYERPILSNLSRFVFLAFVFDAFGVIQNIHVIRNMNFKITFYTTFIGGIISGIVAIIMAYYGYGAWSLATQIVVQSFIRNVLLWVFVKWIPKRIFDRQCIKQMLPYSLKLLAASIMNQVFGNIHSMIIGKFSLNQAGLYSQSKKFSLLPQSVISDGIRVVAYPIMANITEGRDKEKNVFRKIIRLTSFVSFPIAMILIVMANPIISIFLSRKWIETVPMLQILAIGTAIYPLYCLLCTLLQKEGKSGRMFNLELIKNLLIVISIIIGIHWGVMGIVFGLMISQVIAFFIGIILSCHYIHYTIFEFIKDMIPYILISIISYIPMLFFNRIDNYYFRFIIQFIIGSGLYITIVYLMGSVVIKEIIALIKHRINKADDQYPTE